MKKLLLIVAIGLMVSLFADQFKIDTECCVRSLPNTTGKLLTTIEFNAPKLKPAADGITRIDKGSAFNILKVFGDYIYVEVISGSDRAGNKVWIWEGSVTAQTNGTLTVIPSGCTARKSTGKTGEPDGTIKGGAVVKLLDTTATWYNLDINGTVGWVYKSAGSVVKSK